MSFPPGLKRTAAMVVLRHQDQFLLLRRNKEPNRDRYVPVGGKLDPYEDPYSAALREAREETGLTIEKLRYCGTLVETSPVEYNWWCHIYLADIPFEEAPYCNEGTLEWIPYARVLDLPTPPTDWHIYEYLLRGQPFAFNAIYNERLELLSMVEEIEGKRVI